MARAFTHPKVGGGGALQAGEFSWGWGQGVRSLGTQFVFSEWLPWHHCRQWQLTLMTCSLHVCRWPYHPRLVAHGQERGPFRPQTRAGLRASPRS